MRALPLPAGIAVAVVLTAVAAVAATEPPESAFRAANEQYRSGQMSEAAQGYRSLIERGSESGALYYNLGNALFKLGRKGEALWAYLHARRLMPRDSDLRANLEYLRSELRQGAESEIPRSRLTLWLTAGGRFSTGECAALLSVLLWLACGAWVLRSWSPVAKAWLGRVAASLSAGALAASVVLAAQTLGVDRQRLAVTTQDQTQARFAPTQQGTAHFVLPEGSVVRVIETQDGWLQVRRRDGLVGWIAPSDAQVF